MLVGVSRLMGSQRILAAGAPVNTVAPVVSGTFTRGQTLSTTNGTWTGTPTSYTYQWTRNGSPIGSATASTYLLVSADDFTTINCTVTAVNSGGSASASSTNTEKVSAPGYYAVDFDGSADYLTRGANLTGISNTNLFSFSVWFRIDGGDGTVRILFNDKNSTVRCFIEFDSSNRFEFGGRDSAGTSLLHIRTSETFVASPLWTHICGSINSTTGAFTLYMNDQAVGSIITNNTPFTFPFASLTDWAVGAYWNGSSYISLWNGCMSEFWFAPGEYVDFSVTANRRKFIDINGKPVNLGYSGYIPTGTAANIHLQEGA